MRVYSVTHCNSLYGAMGSRYFIFFTPEMAEAITTNGQLIVNTAGHFMNLHLQKILKTDKDYLIYIDTDSVVGSSMIRINGKEMTIADYFENKLRTGKVVKDEDEKMIIQVEGDTTLSMDVSGKSGAREKPVKYVMGHKVKKRLYRITVKDKSVELTGDHSVITSTGPVKPGMLVPGIHKVYSHVTGWTSGYKVEDIGIREEWVYDLEVEDDHNFFANDILVHNSCYISLEDFLNRIYDGNIPGRDDGVEEIMDKFCSESLNKVLSDTFAMLTKSLNCYTNTISMKREKLSDRALFTSKKHYLINTWNSEGVRYDEPKISMTGIEAVKSATPDVCKKKFKDAFKILMSGTEKELQNFLTTWEKEFRNLGPEEIARNMGTNSYNDYVNAKGDYKQGCPMQVRASATYNRMLKEANLTGKYETIQAGDKVKVIHLKMPNPSMENVIAFPGILPRELGLEEYIDYKMQFDKVYMAPLKTITDVISWETEAKADLFAFFG